MPGWAIALIVIFSILIVVGVITAIVSLVATVSKIDKVDIPKKNVTKGKRSETRVDYLLQRYGAVLTNYTLYFGHNASQEIDAILVSYKGVFVIEIKSWAGEIIGLKGDEIWQQYLGRGDIIHNKKNPVKQNEKHCENIKQILKDFNVPIYSLIIFDDGDISRICIENVIKTEQIYDYFDSKEDIIDDSDIKEIVEVLNKNKSEISKDEHIKNVKIQQAINKYSYCPICGKKILHKSVEDGELFYCENSKGCGYKFLVDKNTEFDR